MHEIIQDLFALQDPDYKAFHQKLIPNVDPDLVIGVRTPQLRAYARNMFRSPDRDAFLNALPHRYYEENNLHGFLIEQLRDFDDCIAALDRFLPYVDNWATCDMLRPKLFKTHRDRLYPVLLRWLDSGHTYTVRYAIGMLLTHYLDDGFDPRHLELAAAAACDEYYVNMMIAWYFATALAKQPDAVLPWLTQRRLPLWIHNKTIQKAIESSRISPEQKAVLRTLK